MTITNWIIVSISTVVIIVNIVVLYRRRRRWAAQLERLRMQQPREWE